MSPAAAEVRERLDRDGYAVVPALDAGSAGDLAGAFTTLGLPQDARFYASHAALAPAPRREVHDLVVGAVGPVVARWFPGSRLLAGALLTKGPGAPPLPYHQDVTLTDERARRSYVCWVALVDVDGSSGCIRPVPGSHRWSAGIRPGGPTAMVTEAVQDRLHHLAVDVPVSAGEAVIWDSALVHGSARNHVGRHRPAATVAFAAEDAELQYFHRDAAGVTTGHRVDDGFFFGERPFFDLPRGYPSVEPWAPDVTVEELVAAMDGAAR